MYDIIVIGAGIAGTEIANKLATKYKILVIDKEASSGGVWYQTKWACLTSDTKAYYYTPNSKIGNSVLNKYFFKGIPRQDILAITQSNLQNINKLFDTNVISITFNTESQVWYIHTDNKQVTTYCSKWIINATGIYQTPYLPPNLTEFFDKNNIKYIHSRDYIDTDITKNITVIGSRESGAQLIKGLSKTKKVDWYGRNFNNWYLSKNKHSFIENVLFFIYKIPFIGMFCFMYIRKFLVNKLQNFILCCINNYNTYKIKTKLPETLYKVSNIFRYDYKHPIRPVYIDEINFDNVNVYNITSDLSVFNKYDLVILATGYTYSEPFDIYIDNTKMSCDIFNLVDYVIPYKIPNMLYLLPLSVATYITIDIQINTIMKIINNNFDIVYTISEIDYNKFIEKINVFFKMYNVTREQLCWHSKQPTLIHHSFFFS
jgi:hypothetical protein